MQRSVATKQLKLRIPGQVAREFENLYPSYQYLFVEFLTEHLADVSRCFRGDLQQVLILAVIGQVALQRHLARHGRNGAGAEAEPAISASRLADVTGIPRQTVRRKLKELEARGWIAQTPAASFHLRVVDGNAPAQQDLADIDKRAIERVARLFCNLEKLLAEQSEPAD